LLTDTNGVVSDRYSYDAYGLALDFTFGTLTPLRTAMLYSGERFDSDLQQYYLRARYYNPVVGRFGAQDQVDGTPNDPLSLHKYAYTQNNPVNMRDPSGNEGELISTAFTMTIMDIIFKYEVIRLGGVAVSLTTESARASESLNQMENQPVTPDVHTATIIVHGVNGLWNGQPNGWSKDFQADLRAKDKTPSQQKGVNGIVTGAGLNQDFYEFDWGGFSFDGSGFYPIKSVHTMALIHLRAAEELILMKGYGFFNIISHSWGTTLSYDLMNSSNIEVDNWVTMGSPLKWTTEKPLENTGNWFNYYSSKDPVMHYEIYPPFPSFYEMANAVFAGIKGGQGLSGDSSQKINHPFDMGQSSFKEHTAYWSWLPCVDSLRKDLQ
jgi:RHS repeat-associated protein